MVGVFGTIRCRLELCQRRGRKPAWKQAFRIVRRVGLCWLATCIHNSSAKYHYDECAPGGSEHLRLAPTKKTVPPVSKIISRHMTSLTQESTVSDQQVMWKCSREILLLWQKIKSFCSSRSLIKYHKWKLMETWVLEGKLSKINLKFQFLSLVEKIYYPCFILFTFCTDSNSETKNVWVEILNF